MATSEAEKGRHDGPILGTPGDFPERPERKGRLVVHVVIAILCAVCAGGWGYVMWAAGVTPRSTTRSSLLMPVAVILCRSPSK
ncbi:hypothetical protein ACFQX6_49940 [Streptosporangium lutulentum]